MNSKYKDLEKGYSQYYDDFDLYMRKYIVPEVYARQLSSYYCRNLIDNETLTQYIGSIKDVFNVSFSFDDVRDDVEEILRIKYNLVITSDEPLKIEECKQNMNNNVISDVKRGSLIVISSKSNIDMTTFILDYIVTDVVYRLKRNVMYFSLAKSSRTIKNCLENIINEKRILDTENNLTIIDTPNLTINDIEKEANKLTSSNGLDLIVIDYEHLIDYSGNKDIKHELEELAKRLNITIISINIRSCNK